MKLYHYTHPSKCLEILRGESPGLNPVSVVSSAEGRELYGSFALLEPQPDNWINNAYFPDFWNRLINHMGQILLEVDVNPSSDGVIVIDRGHMVKFNSSLPGGSVTSNVPQQFDHETLEQALDAYVQSGIPILDYLQKSGDSPYVLSEAAITRPIFSKRIHVSGTQPLLEDELRTGGLQIGDIPPEDRPIEDRIRSARGYVKSIPELQGWFEGYRERMKSEPAPK
jgi:hypothetical protein